MGKGIWMVLAALAVGVVGCDGDGGEPGASAADVWLDAGDDATDAGDDGVRDVEVGEPDVPEPGPPTVHTDYTLEAGFFAAPFPDEARRGPDGTPSMAGYPNPDGVGFVTSLVDMVESDLDGFGTTSGVYFSLTEPIDPAGLPTLRGSLEDGAAVYLVGVEPGSADYGVRVPVTSLFETDGGPYGAANQLSVVPLQGRPLRPLTTYAAVVTDRLSTPTGVALTASSQLTALRRGADPAGMQAEVASLHRDVLAELDDPRAVAVAVFRTGDPTRDFVRAREAILGQPLPEVEGPWVADEVFDDFCVFSNTVQMPVFQNGDPPFNNGGGRWELDADGRPRVQGSEQSRVVVTLPRTAMPEAGFPVTVFVRTGGGGDRPLVDRGVHAEPHGPNIEEGAGPARHLSRAGFAGVSVDGPHGGLRNVTGTDEQFLIFNFQNPVAMRDNIRESALELVLLAHMLGAFEVEAGSCPDLELPEGQGARFDTDTVVLMGHSMGATIGPLTLATEPIYKAGVFSGAGGSWIANVIHKLEPLPVRPVARLLVGYRGRDLHEHDPVLALLLQWGGESADPPVYARRTIHEPVEGESPRHVLMVQGVADTYILPPMANALSLSLGLDLAGPELDRTHPVAGEFTPLADLLDLTGRQRVDLPAAGNIAGEPPVTAVVVQHLEDGIENGHEVFFQLDPPKHQYECFLRTLTSGTPLVPTGEQGVCR